MLPDIECGGVQPGGLTVGESQQQDEARKRKHQKIQQQLDEALANSFPASDPVSIVTSHEEEDWGIEPLTPPVSRSSTGA
jgi:hypothetical protein